MSDFWLGFLTGSLFGTSTALLVQAAIAFAVVRFLIGRVPQ